MIRDIEGPCVGVPVPAGVRPDESGAVGGPREPRTTFRAVLLGLRESERETDAWMDKALGGKVADPDEMLRFQVVVHRFQIQVELAAKIVDQVSQAIRTLTRPT